MSTESLLSSMGYHANKYMLQGQDATDAVGEGVRAVTLASGVAPEVLCVPYPTTGYCSLKERE